MSKNIYTIYMHEIDKMNMFYKNTTHQTKTNDTLSVFTQHPGTHRLLGFHTTWRVSVRSRPNTMAFTAKYKNTDYIMRPFNTNQEHLVLSIWVQTWKLWHSILLQYQDICTDVQPVVEWRQGWGQTLQLNWNDFKLTEQLNYHERTSDLFQCQPPVLPSGTSLAISLAREEVLRNRFTLLGFQKAMFPNWRLPTTSTHPEVATRKHRISFTHREREHS